MMPRLTGRTGRWPRISAFIRTLLDDASATDAVATLGAVSISGGQNLTGGFTGTSGADGTKSSGTYTPDPLTGNFKHITANGAFAFGPPTAECTVIVEIVNGASAGAITAPSFTKTDLGAYNTTNGNKFFATIVKTKNYSHISLTALQ